MIDPRFRLLDEPGTNFGVRFPTELRIANGLPKGKTLPWSKLVKHNLFDVSNVPPHSRLCAFGIAALDRSQDPSVAGERLLRPTLHLQRAFPRLAQQVHENIEHLEHDTVPGSQRNVVVEFRVLGDGGVSQTLLFLL